MALLRRKGLRALDVSRSLPIQARYAHYPNEHYKAESQSQKDGTASNASRDAVYASHGEQGSKGDVTQQRQSQSTPESGGFQPGQAGEQTGGHGPGRGEGTGKTTEATSPKKLDSVRQKLGLGSSSQHRHLHVSALNLANTDPSKIRGEQNEHLVHSEADKPDKMPAVRSSAALPSKEGKSQDKSGASTHPMADSEPLGYGSAPEGLAGKDNPHSDPKSKRSLHTSAFVLAEATQASSQGLPNHVPASYRAPPEQSHVTPTQGSSRDQFKRTYVRGQPEPNSYRLGYNFIDYTTPEAFQAPMPSSAVPPSSTSTEPANPHTTTVDLEHNDLKLPPDFDVQERGQWMQKLDQEKELPPTATRPSGGTRDLREAPRGPRDAPETVDQEQATSAPHSAAATAAKTQVAQAKGADPESSTGQKDSAEAKPAFPGEVLGAGEAQTTLSAAATKTRKARSGPSKAKKS